MSRRLEIHCGALVALVLAISTAAAASQAVPSCPGVPCGPTDDRSSADARATYERKQEFVAAIRQLSIALNGRFGDEGRGLRSSIDALETALRRWDLAIVAFETALQGRGYDADAYTALGAVYLDRYRVEDALRSFDAAATIDARRAEVYGYIAMAHGLAGRRAQAVDALERAAEIQPDDAIVRYEIARYAMEADASPSARALDAFQIAAGKKLARPPVANPFTRPGLIRQTAGVAPIFPPAPYVDAFELLMKGRFEEAIAECRAAIDRDPLIEVTGDDDLLIGGAAALRRGDLPKALSQLRAAAEAAPDRSEARRILGVALRLDEQLDQSVEAFNAAIRARPTDERSRMGLADVLVDMERFADAEALLTETIRVVPNALQARYRLGRVHQSTGKYEEALKEFEYVARFAPLAGQDPLHEMIAVIHATQADFAGAVPALRTQIAVNPNNADAHRRLAESYARLERAPEALTEFTAALLIDRRNVLSQVGISQIHFRSGDLRTAAGAARAALDLDPSQREARYVLAMSLTRLGQTGEAKRELEEFQRLQAAAAAETQRKYELDELRRQISMSIGAGEYQTAIPLLHRLIAREPDVAAHYVSLGTALARSGQTPEAIEAFRMALQREPFDANAHRYLAEAYLAAGQLDASRAEANRYRQLIELAKTERALRFGNP